jgi:hypothetical protein
LLALIGEALPKILYHSAGKKQNVGLVKMLQAGTLKQAKSA